MKNSISGIALKNGLILTSDGITCIARKKTSGKITLKIKTHPHYIKKFQPFLLIIILLLALIPDTSISPESTIYTIILPISIFIILLRIIPHLRILNYHGAEHKVVVAYVNRIPLTLQTVKPICRVTKICGSMLIMPIIFYALLLSFSILFTENTFIHILLTIISILLIIHYFLLRGDKLRYIYLNTLFPFLKKRPYKLKTNTLYKLFDKSGYFLQEHFTTKEPSDEELKVAIICMQELIKSKQKIKVGEEE